MLLSIVMMVKNEERYLEFAEDFYKDDMHHKIIENMLKSTKKQQKKEL